MLPGLVGPGEYLARLREAVRFHEVLNRADAGGMVAEAELVQVPPGRAALAERSPSALHAAAKNERQVADLAKSMVEGSVKRWLGELHEAAAQDLEACSGAPEDEALALDTQYNREHRYPPAHHLLESRPLASRPSSRRPCSARSSMSTSRTPTSAWRRWCWAGSWGGTGGAESRPVPREHGVRAGRGAPRPARPARDTSN